VNLGAFVEGRGAVEGNEIALLGLGTGTFDFDFGDDLEA
jgi:hypothetical protein